VGSTEIVARLGSAEGLIGTVARKSAELGTKCSRGKSFWRRARGGAKQGPSQVTFSAPLVIPQPLQVVVGTFRQLFALVIAKSKPVR
jgi:hypothetical protein